ncbi:hypothetical protein PUN28_000660 [Cardiocondyla obscurior]|uniref:Uncharacterized protein n=1 Tax=Cardiocondyla obscurior TaxID=286306 RepID=A0AAW2H0G8_9HYME
MADQRLAVDCVRGASQVVPPCVGVRAPTSPKLKGWISLRYGNEELYPREFRKWNPDYELRRPLEIFALQTCHQSAGAILFFFSFFFSLWIFAQMFHGPRDCR